MKLLVKDLSYSYENRKDEERGNIFSNLNMEFTTGSIAVIEGENGSGKTTFLKLLSCILEVVQGEVSFNGISIKNNEYKKYMAYIPDNPILFDELTGEEHVLLFCDLWELSGEYKDQYILNVKELVNYFLLDKFIKQKVRVYSLGTKYKLFLILMLARRPRVILLDEPLTALDFNAQENAIDLLKDISKEAIIIISSHQKELIDKLATEKYKIEKESIIHI